jgi:hypothetical protein
MNIEHHEAQNSCAVAPLRYATQPLAFAFFIKVTHEIFLQKFLGVCVR